MKKYLTLLLLYCITAHAQKASPKMDGVYTMTKQMVNNGVTDQVIPTKQLKMYNGRYVMYAAAISPTDSLASFGIGTYHVKNGKVIENFFYTAAGGALIDTAILTIEQSPKGYKQVIVYPPMMDTIYTLTEEYDKVDKSMVSAIDGAWKLNTSYMIAPAGDTVINKVTQYKMYRGGHFIWSAGYVDSATAKNQGVFGFGTFTLKGSKLTEKNTQSTYTSQLVGIPVVLDIAFKGKNEYTQTISWPDGTKGVETYTRLE